MQELKKRLKKIEKLDEKLDGILIFNTGEKTQSAFVGDPNFFYFTNSNTIGAFYYDFNEAKIFTNIMEERRAKNFWIKNITTHNLKDFTKTLKNKKIGIDKQNISAAVFDKIKTHFNPVDISKELSDARKIKTTNEIENIKKACNITGKIFREIKNKTTEINIKNKIHTEINKHSESAFPIIVATGKNIEIPHHTPTNQKISGTCLIDFGVRVNGYCSDVTRTFGSKLENILKDVILQVEDKLQPGTETKKLDETARKHMKQHSKFFITGLGHGLGIEVHEKPYIAKNSKDVLKSGMVLTIEPGIYVKNGIRIENDYLITKNGFKCLTKF